MSLGGGLQNAYLPGQNDMDPLCRRTFVEKECPMAAGRRLSTAHHVRQGPIIETGEQSRTAEKVSAWIHMKNSGLTRGYAPAEAHKQS